MGIPRYFSYIIKNYPAILRKFAQCEKFQHLLIDSNSIVYDVFHRLDADDQLRFMSQDAIETIIIQEVIQKIAEYIHFIQPEKTVYIAFDGPAPAAKVEQQRMRRYKTAYLAQMSQQKPKPWDTVAITPGTPFMRRLSEAVYRTFLNRASIYGLHDIHVSCSDQAGEGEHKLFDYLREMDFRGDTVALYGLDADLIMLSILNHARTKEIYVFREAPNFQGILSHLPAEMQQPGERIFLKVSTLVQRIGDVDFYVCRCMMFGNDFLPKMACSSAIMSYIETVNDVETQKQRPLIDRLLDYCRRVLKFLGQNELLDEYTAREKNDRQNWRRENLKMEELVEFAPRIYRQDEKYVNPTEPGWERRYNKLCPNDVQSYVEGILWVMQYYKDGCKDWSWKYPHNHAPLLCDLVKYRPPTGKTLSDPVNAGPQDAALTLKYVIPPKRIDPATIHFDWIFRNYTWESHIHIL
jgi:5'-3' exonuclease